jgi:signal transduction histidine kinase
MFSILPTLHFAKIAPSKLEKRQMEDTPNMPVETRRSGLIFGAGAIALCIASILAIGSAITCHTAGAVLARGLSWVPSLLYGAILWLWWAGVAYLVWSAGRRNAAIFQASIRNLLLQISFGITTSTLHLGTLHFATRLMGQLWPQWHIARFDTLTFFEIGRFSLDFLIYALIWSACAIIYMQIAAQQEAFRSLELQQQLSAAKLHALQMQLQPHFLFNTLNAITTLVRLGRQKEADAMLSHLNAILKATLATATPEKIPLAQELETIDSYLAIEQARFTNRLRVEMKIDPAALDGLVPCFLLQPIVENAIRHGIGRQEKDGMIQTSVARNGNRLHLRVVDNGPGTRGKSASGHGIGLKNTRERLAHFYQDHYEMTITEPISGGYEVAITIPYERGRP